MSTYSPIFFNAAQNGLALESIKPEDLGFLKASLFDCDGVLLDSEFLAMSDLGRTLHNAMVEIGHTGIADIPAFVTQYFGGHAETIIGEIVKQEGLNLDAKTINELHKISVIETLKNEVQSFEGLPDVLSLMHKATHGKQAVVTSSGHARVIPGLEKNQLISNFHDLEGLMRVYGVPDTLPHDATSDTDRYPAKPQPHIYQHAVRDLGIDDPASVSTMEDSSSGVKSAVAAGLGYVIGFVGGSHIPAERKQAAAENLLNLGAHKVILDVRAYPGALIEVHRERLAATPKPAAGAAPGANLG